MKSTAVDLYVRKVEYSTILVQCHVDNFISNLNTYHSDTVYHPVRKSQKGKKGK